LQGEVLRLRAELAAKNRDLATSVEENIRMRQYQTRILQGLPCGILVWGGDGEVLLANSETRRLLEGRAFFGGRRGGNFTVSNASQTISTLAVVLDDSQREKLLLEHLPQVQYIARRIHDRVPPQVLLEDLVHAGILGLMDAVKKYDPSKNVQLKHYAEFRIRGAILDSLRQVDWSPRTLRRQARRLEQAISECKAIFKRDPSEPEIAAQLGVTLESLQHLLGDLRGLDIGSLQAETNEAGFGDDFLQSRPGAEEDDPYHQTLRSEITTLLGRAVGELPEREREVLALYHYEELTMKEVGAVLGIGESRVSQIHTTALLRLRARLHDLLNARQATPGAERASEMPMVPFKAIDRAMKGTGPGAFVPRAPEMAT
jgi:RNA polymerase sigma factor for flagellar operon FliA